MQTLRKYWGPIVAAGLMLLEAVLILFLTPNGCSQRPEAEQAQAQPAEPVIEIKEVSIGGPQRVTNYVDPGLPIRIEFEVVAVVHLESAEEFEKILEKREGRLVELVREVVAAARVDEIRDPHLPWIKKELLQGVQEIIGRDKQYLVTIVIPTFNPHDI